MFNYHNERTKQTNTSLNPPSSSCVPGFEVGVELCRPVKAEASLDTHRSRTLNGRAQFLRVWCQLNVVFQN